MIDLILTVFFSSSTVLPPPSASGIPTESTPAARYLDTTKGLDWPGYGRTYSEQHYSPLEQVNSTNIERLRLAWFMDLGPENSVTQPIAVDGVLYFGTGHSIVHAVRASDGKLLWRYDPKAAERAGLNLRIGWGSRGISWWNGKIYTGTTDGRLLAIDARTGELVWSVQTFDTDIAGYISGAPRVFDGKVIIGFGGDVGKNRGYVTTYDAETGQRLWRFYTVPGNPTDGFESNAMRMAAKTWKGEWWRFGGGGTAWNAMAYDHDTDTVYIGTGSAYPHNRRVRSLDQGDNLFTSSIVALSGKSGAYKWHYQVTPGDTWDFDATMDLQLADIDIDGQHRKVLLQAPKNGFFYVIDRNSGRLLSAAPYTKVTWASRIDLNSGRPVEKPGARYPGGTTADIWPSAIGGHSWMPMAYSPKTRLAYIPEIEAGEQFSDRGLDLAHWHPSTDRTGEPSDVNADITSDAKTRCRFGVGALLAWDPAAQKEAWRITHPTVVNGGVLVTGGDIVLQGTIDGTFKAYSATNGALLWSFSTQAPLVAPPISYSVAGIQYISVLTGLGTGAGVFASATPGVEKYGIDPRSQARRVLTFALDGTSHLPTNGRPPPQVVDDPGFRPAPHRSAAGADIYNLHCLTCHGVSLVGAMHAPDLRRSWIPLTSEAFRSVVHDGRLEAGGMPPFPELTAGQLEDLRQYIRGEARSLRTRGAQAETCR